MATAEQTEPEATPTCLMCLEAPAVVTLESCQHSYCKTCLERHDVAKSERGESFPCPACQKQGPRGRSEDGAGEEEVTKSRGHGASGRLGLRKTQTPVEDVVKENCKACGHKEQETEAVNVCWECVNLTLCLECTLVHAEGKTTKGHLVVPLAMKANLLCDAHGEPLKSYCCDCSQPVCPVCLVLDHSKHEVKKLSDVGRAKMAEVKTGIGSEEKRLERLRRDERELVESKAVAVDMEDALIKDIEDQAEMCIEQILKNKDTLKKQVKKEFDMIWEMTKQLEAMPQLISQSEKALANAKELLEGMERNPKLWSTDTNQLFSDPKITQPEYEKRRENYRKMFKSAKDKSLAFYPKTPNLDIGGFEKPNPRKLRAICKGKGFCTCEICGKIPLANQSRKGECERQGACRCKVCDQVIKKGNIRRLAECDRQGSCTCKVCDQEIRKASSDRKWECDRLGSCTCKVCDQTLRKADCERRQECYRQGFCTCRVCNRKMLYPRHDLKLLCDERGSCLCMTCGQEIRKASHARKRECVRQGHCTCKVCDQEIRKAGSDRKWECDRLGSCTCKVCDQKIWKASHARKWECERQGHCTCKVCNQAIRKASRTREWECERQGYCTCKLCNQEMKKASPERSDECDRQGSCTCGVCGDLFRRPWPCRRNGWLPCECQECNQSSENRLLLLIIMSLLGLVVLLFMYFFSYFADYPSSSVVEKHKLLGFIPQ